MLLIPRTTFAADVLIQATETIHYRTTNARNISMLAGRAATENTSSASSGDKQFAANSGL